MSVDPESENNLKASGSQRTVILVGLMVLFWAIVLAGFAIARHQRLNSSAYDLAIESQVVWNTFQGNWFASSIEVRNYLGDHVAPIIVLITPLFAIWEDVRILLILQAVMLSLGVVPVYRIARRHLYNLNSSARGKSEERIGPATANRNKRSGLSHPSFPLALLFAAIYLLYPAIGFVNRFDFHPITFTILFLLLAYDLLEIDRPVWATFFVLLALACREDIGFTVFAFGIYVAFVERRRSVGFIWSLTGLIWSLTAIYVVIPHFRGGASDTIARYSWLGDDLTTMLRTIFSQPTLVFNHVTEPFRLQFLLKLLLPLGFLPLLSPLALLIIVPALVYNLLSETPSQSSIYFHYISPIIPFLFIAGIQGAAWSLKKVGRNKEVIGVRANALIASWLILWTAISWLIDNPFTKVIEAPYYPVYALEQVIDGDAFWMARALIPPEASVATTQAYAPHVALRPQLTLFHNRLRMEEYAHGFPQEAYLLLNLSDYRWGVNARIFLTALETAIGKYGYEAIYFQNDVVVLTRDTVPQMATGDVIRRIFELQEAGGKFAPAAETTLDWTGRQWLVEQIPENAVDLATEFEGGINLVASTVSEIETVAGRPLCVTLYWQTKSVVTTPYTVFVHLTSRDNYVQTQNDSQPVQGFYPFTKWQPGELFADLHCFQLPPQLPTGGYQLKVGLYDPLDGQRVSTSPLGTDMVTLPYQLLIDH